MFLPNADRAFVDERKLADYSLSPEHPVGRHKATVFRAAFGFSPADSNILRPWVLNAARSVEAQAGFADEYGQRFRVDFAAETLAGTLATIRSAWIVRPDEDFPRLNDLLRAIRVVSAPFPFPTRHEHHRPSGYRRPRGGSA